jgi:hypothetical protein
MYGRRYAPRRRNVKSARQLAATRRNQRTARAALAQAWPKGSATSVEFYGADRASANATQRAVRRGLSYRGAGDYKSMLRTGVKYGSRALGAGVGFMMDGVQGMKAGYQVGSRLSKKFGFGVSLPFFVSTNFV